ncbi:MAG: DJ-1/PfpI family protein, partial [Oscillospiraceae bacterium]
MIYVFLADGFEETEAITTIDYLRRCELDVKTVSIKAPLAPVAGLIVTGSHKIKILADITANDVNLEEIDMIVLPGGMPGTLNLEMSTIVNTAIDYCVKNNKFIGAICAAPSILGHKGLLNGKNATCFTGFEDELLGANV